MDKVRSYTPAEMAAQEKVVIDILRFGTPTEFDRLRAALMDPEVHPQVREMIRMIIAVWDLSGDVTERETIILKPKGVIDLKVVAAAKTIGTNLRAALVRDELVQIYAHTATYNGKIK